MKNQILSTFYLNLGKLTMDDYSTDLCISCKKAFACMGSRIPPEWWCRKRYS